jgi:[glutamine synthetase] adenylyltransferase / [glutamine synthetase]-adenylyl-L-tyrosine phosphorylase
MGTAPSLAEHLSRNPRELETVLDRGFFEPLPGRDALAASLERTLAREQGGLEPALDAVRRWTKEQHFRAGIQILRNLTDGDRCGPFLADVAELAIGALQPLVEREFAVRHGSFPGGGMAVLAMGALGGRQMTFRSDLDLIIVYDIPENAAASDGPKPLSPPNYYIRLTQRLLSAITALTAEGRLYEVDMRLRPSGNKGPLAVSLEGFRRYQTEGAWTWEHMALTRARAITGAPELRERIEGCIRAVLARQRDPGTLLGDVADMRQRIEREHGTKDIWNLKYYRGGLVDIDFLVQYLVLLHAHDHPSLLDQRTEIVLKRLAAEEILPEEAARDVGMMLALARRVQGFLRLTSESGSDLANAPVALRHALARAAFPENGADIDLPELKTRIAEAAAQSLRWFQSIIEAPAARIETKHEQEAL